MEPDNLTIVRVPTGELFLDPANVRTHDAANMAAIAASLQRFGQAEPLVVQRGTRRVIGGNGRLAAMRSLGWAECDVVELDLDEVAATALGIALNRTAELADWDEGALAELLSALKAEDALDGTGFTAEAIDDLLRSLEPEPGELEDVEAGDVPEEPVSKPGDPWLLGEHRVLCGDSTNAEHVARLMGETRADLVWTDAPYGVSYTGGTAEALTIQNDQLRDAELERFLRAAFTNALDGTKPGGVWYAAAPAGPQFLQFAKVLTDLGVWRQTLVWAKDSLVLGHSDFHYRHEAVFYGWKPGAAHREPPDRKQDSIWEFARPKASREHPTMKPIELVAHALRMSSVQGEAVLDPFAGSGTTILAAESTGRRAFGMELDPRYVDVIVDRWQRATGNDARLESGETFAETREARS